MPCRSFRTEHALNLGLGAVLDGASMPFAEPGVEPHYAPSRTVRIEHIDLSITLAVRQERFSGEARIRFICLPTFEGTVDLDLDDVTVDDVTNGEGEALRWTHDSDHLRVHGVGGDGVVVVRWHHSKPTRGLYFTGPTACAPDRQQMAWTQCQDEDAHFAFPCHDHPGIKHPWTLRLRSEAGYTLLSNGAVVEEGEDADGAFAVFEQAEPMPAYLVNIVAAQLSVEETTWRGKSVRYLVPVGEEEAVLRAFGKTPIMLDAYSDITGVEYPWPRYDQVVVHDFIFGGMENVAVTTMTDLLLVDEMASLEWDPDRLVCHELAHQWFGDLLTCQDWSQGWLNESWATFMEVVWWEHDRSAEDANWYAYTQMLSYLGEDSGRYRRPIVSYRFKEPIDVFDRHLYEKGAVVMRTLRTQLGADAFWAGVKLYLDRHRHGTVHTRHFQRALEDATGRNLDQFFQQWIWGAGHPALSVKVAHKDGLLMVTVKQTQSGDETADAFHLPLALEVVREGEAPMSITLPLAERERTWAIPVSGDVASVRVDPGFQVLSTITLDAPRGWLERLAADACPVLAARAIQALLADGSGKAVRSALDAFAAHPAYQVREHIAGKLGQRGGDEARDALLAAFASDDHPRVRRAAASALGNYRDQAVADAMIDEVNKDDVGTWHLRAAALRTLGKTRDPRAVRAIRPHLQVESWADAVAGAACMGLANTRDPAVLDDLVACSRVGNRPRVRAGAALALGELGDKVEAVRQNCVERLVEMLDEPGFREQNVSIMALGTLKHPASIGPLTKVHTSAPDGRTQRSAYEALYKIRQGRTTEAGLAALRDEMESLRKDNAKLRGRLEKLERLES